MWITNHILGTIIVRILDRFQYRLLLGQGLVFSRVGNYWHIDDRGRDGAVSGGGMLGQHSLTGAVGIQPSLRGGLLKVVIRPLQVQSLLVWVGQLVGGRWGSLEKGWFVVDELLHHQTEVASEVAVGVGSQRLRKNEKLSDTLYTQGKLLKTFLVFSFPSNDL